MLSTESEPQGQNIRVFLTLTKNFKPLTIFRDCTARFVSDIFGTPEDGFSNYAAYLILTTYSIRILKAGCYVLRRYQMETLMTIQKGLKTMAEIVSICHTDVAMDIVIIEVSHLLSVWRGNGSRGMKESVSTRVISVFR